MTIFLVVSRLKAIHSQCSMTQARDFEMDLSEPVDDGWTQHFILMSSMYAQLLVVICITFFTSEVVTPLVPLFYFEGFYLFMYSISLLFLLYINLYILRNVPASTPSSIGSGKKPSIMENLRRLGDHGQKLEPGETPIPPRVKKSKISDNDRSHGSLFLRIGAIAFGLGTMVYNGLEFGQFFEIPQTSPCYSVLLGINPVLHMIFTFAQMYFIFVNARINIHKFKMIARFGLMHMVATNLCIWIRTLGKETLHEVARNLLKRGHGGLLEEFMMPFRELNNSNISNPCQKEDILGNIVASSSPFLYPFIVEYSLIGAAVLYVMWKNVGKDPVFQGETQEEDRLSRTSSIQSTNPVNCSGSSKGLFCGLLVLVICVICLIVFFVLIFHNHYRLLAIYLSDLSHCTILVLAIVGIIIGFFRVKPLRFSPFRKDQLRDILLRVAAFGLYIHSMFGIIAGSLSTMTYIPNILLLITSCLTMLQITLQSLFIADMSCRTAYLPEQDQQKPGRQVVTFLMISNLTLWIIYTFQMQKVEASPVEREFYGIMGWAVITRVTLPLSIFYRFHSAVTFAEIWKNSYKNISF
ncbi:proton channel OtopLc-like isoform X2 [Tachypleus tridentatus]|uniref:proton channel OtopLc-like isoform X2 n=2 Tax=Tachypleus tridentatus TaxID=6853 RepID=UPI003FD672FF